MISSNPPPGNSTTENADLARERRELAELPEAELEELTQIYMDRGVEPALARQVAGEMMAKDAIAAHARDELGLSEHVVARPIQTALTSAATFSAGAALPLLIAVAAAAGWIATAVFGGSLAGLAVLGALGAKVGGASVLKPTVRVTFWGAFAMGATAVIGSLVGRAV
jgi:VIT1/CCC1 family predicted Fe2+/Mn2+ transporter